MINIEKPAVGRHGRFMARLTDLQQYGRRVAQHQPKCRLGMMKGEYIRTLF